MAGESGKLLISGMGGGLDIVNASVLFYAARNAGKDTVLGSVKSAPISELENAKPFADNGAWVDEKLVVNYKKGGYGAPRYAEPLISKYLGTDVIYFTESFGSEKSVAKMTKAIEKARELYDLENMIFVDGGGDSMIFVSEDACKDSEGDDPFGGGDAFTQEAIADMEKVYMAVMTVGLDIDEGAFNKNRKMLEEMGAYYGKVNLLTGEKVDYKLNDILPFNAEFLDDYFKLAENVMVLSDEDKEDPNKKKSHTGVVTYFALKEKYGQQSTFIMHPGDTEERGALIKPDHCWCYFFDASKIHQLKLELNRERSTK